AAAPKQAKKKRAKSIQSIDAQVAPRPPATSSSRRARSRASALIEALATLEARDRARRDELVAGGRGAT
ncbi:MAG: hypothetical protein AAGF90_17645, partial [Pseudomonadota bacterium]